MFFDPPHPYQKFHFPTKLRLANVIKPTLSISSLTTKRWTLPRHFRDTTASFGRFVETFFRSINYTQRSGELFGDDTLYKLMFYLLCYLRVTYVRRRFPVYEDAPRRWRSSIIAHLRSGRLPEDAPYFPRRLWRHARTGCSEPPPGLSRESRPHADDHKLRAEISNAAKSVYPDFHMQSKCLAQEYWWSKAVKCASQRL